MTKRQQEKQYQLRIKQLENYDNHSTKDLYIKLFKFISNELKVWQNESLLSDFMKRYQSKYLHYCDTRTIDQKISDYKKENPITDKIRK